MKEREAIRKKVWGDLRRVARPDSRFHWDFTAFIPDYEGSDLCAGTIREMDLYHQAQTIFVTPDNNLAVFNYGLHFTYRVQRNDPTDFYGNAFANEGGDVAGLGNTYVQRLGQLYIPDLWIKFERKLFRLELD